MPWVTDVPKGCALKGAREGMRVLVPFQSTGWLPSWTQGIAPLSPGLCSADPLGRSREGAPNGAESLVYPTLKIRRLGIAPNGGRESSPGQKEAWRLMPWVTDVSKRCALKGAREGMRVLVPFQGTGCLPWWTQGIAPLSPGLCSADPLGRSREGAPNGAESLVYPTLKIRRLGVAPNGGRESSPGLKEAWRLMPWVTDVPEGCALKGAREGTRVLVPFQSTVTKSQAVVLARTHLWAL
ncbi:MAG: hypothetical protein JNJ83_23535 [Verrucomicrobiaceae bacterium]|nr:hypothetical protein [Verrucomicrobiaceae bacterium]